MEIEYKKSDNTCPFEDLDDGVAFTQAGVQRLDVDGDSNLARIYRFYEDEILSSDETVKTDNILVSTTYGLKQRKSELSAIKLYKVLESEGLIVRKERPSTKHKNVIRKFWKLTQAGLEYGENQVSPRSPKQTQPLFYESRFDALLGKVGV